MDKLRGQFCGMKAKSNTAISIIGYSQQKLTKQLEVKIMAYNKTGVVRYNVTTDTHGYPWGFRNGVDGKVIHFDLGDNTAGCAAGEFDNPPETISTATGIALYGNHDTAVLGGELKGLQEYRDNANQIIVFGLDTGTNDVNTLQIPTSQVDDMAKTLSELAGSWDVIVLTHVPLYPGENTAENPNWKCGEMWGGSKASVDSMSERLFALLNAFKAHKKTVVYTTSKGTKYSFESTNGYVIGCFAGHIHGHVKCTYKGFPMETFTTNGSDEWTYDQKGGHSNMGLYVPYENYIHVNFDYMTINGMNIRTPEKGYFHRYDNYHPESNCYYASNAAGYFKLNASSTLYPKFYSGHYIGYSSNPLDGITTGKNGRNDRYWPFGTTINLKINGQNQPTSAIWFDTNGRLRYYATTTPVSDYRSYKEIFGYKTATVTFTANNINWVFKGGLLESATPNFRSGTLYGKNGYTLEFNSSGVPYQIKLNGAVKTYPAGDNWINVTDIQIYDNTAKKTITTVPQIGITGTFNSSSKINLARANSNGTNQISAPDGLLIRVQGVSSNPMWLYDGKLTSLTDAQVL